MFCAGNNQDCKECYSRRRNWKKALPKRKKNDRHRTMKYINNIHDNKNIHIPPTNVTYNGLYKSSQWVRKAMNHINTIMYIVLFRILWYKTNNFSNFNCFNIKSSSEIWICEILFCFFEETNHFALCACNFCKSFCSSYNNERKRADICC